MEKERHRERERGREKERMSEKEGHRYPLFIFRLTLLINGVHLSY